MEIVRRQQIEPSSYDHVTSVKRVIPVRIIMKNFFKEAFIAITISILLVVILDQVSSYQQSALCESQQTNAVETIYDTPAAPEGYAKMNGFYHASLTEQNTCATDEFPIGTKVSIWCGIDAKHGSSIEATVVSNQVHIDTVDTIELSEDINDFFAGGTTMYAVWVKEV